MTPPPTRRHSPAVYRRRRLMLILVLVVVAAAVWLLIAQPWQGVAQPVADAAPSPSGTSTVSAPPTSASPIPSVAVETTAPAPTVDAVAASCTAANVTVEALTSRSSYPSGSNPELSIKLANNGTQPCTINVGTSSQSFTISSGNDVWWRSTDCQQEPSDMLVTLAAGQSVTSAQPLVWDRTRSSVSTCDSSSRQRATGGGASYHLAVEVGGISSAQSAQFLLD